MSKIDESLDAIEKLGLPKAQRNERSALTLLAILDLKKKSPWSKARARLIRIHDMIVFIEKYYAKQYAENSRETIRRQTIHQFIQAGILDINPDDPLRPTNSPNTVYQVTQEALNVFKTYGTEAWKTSLYQFQKSHGKLIEKYEKRKNNRNR